MRCDCAVLEVKRKTVHVLCPGVGFDTIGILAQLNKINFHFYSQFSTYKNPNINISSMLAGSKKMLSKRQ
jgi:hypothetical protein